MDRLTTVWAAGQVLEEPTKTRIHDCGQWLKTRLAGRDLLVVGYWTDWDYLNEVLRASFREVIPRRVIVVDTCETEKFAEKAPALYDLGNLANAEFYHVQNSGNTFLDKLRVDFSKGFIRRILYSGKSGYTDSTGIEPENVWLEPVPEDAQVLWQLRRDLEGCNPNEPSKKRNPSEEPLVGITILQLQARGAVSNGSYWILDDQIIRVISAANCLLHEVESAFSGEIAPAIAPAYTIAVGAESVSLPSSIARGSGDGSIVRGPSAKWLSRADAVAEFSL